MSVEIPDKIVLKKDLHNDVTAKILEELKNGVRPWEVPWSQTPGCNVPGNAVTGRPYSGINVLLLWAARAQGWPQARFLTFKQAREAGGHVRAGEHGHRVVFVKDVTKRPDEGKGEDEASRYRMLKSYTVFNIAQCDDLPEHLRAAPKPSNPDQCDELICEFITAIGAKVKATDEDRAYYTPSGDYIITPKFKSFRSYPHFAATLFHELIHWTGHKSRLNRQLGERFGLRARAAEEMIAELGAAFLCAEFSIDPVVPHAAYLKKYVELLEDDPRAIFTAAAKAQNAVDFLRQKSCPRLQSSTIKVVSSTNSSRFTIARKPIITRTFSMTAHKKALRHDCIRNSARASRAPTLGAYCGSGRPQFHDCNTRAAQGDAIPRP